MEGSSQRGVRLGLKENWRQFALLMLVNGFVGGMVGLERTVVPLVGAQEFGLVLKTPTSSPGASPTASAERRSSWQGGWWAYRCP